MAFDPDAFVGGAPAAPAAASGGFDPDAFIAGPAAPAAPPSTAEAIARGAVQGASLGFADEGQAALEALFAFYPESSLEHYRRRRDEIRKEYQNAQSAHPWAYGLSELGGGFAAPLPGMGAAKGIAGALKTGAVMGGLGALGSTQADITRGELAPALKDVALGAGTGAALSGALHGIASKVAGGAEDRFVSDVATDTTGRARPKDQLQARRIFLADKGDAELSSRDILFTDDVKPIVKAARRGDTEEARGLIAEKLDTLKPARTADYNTLDRTAGPAPVRPVVEGFEDAIARQRLEADPAATHVLKASKKALEDAWSGVPAGMTRAALKGAAEGLEGDAAKAVEAAIAKLPEGNSTVTNQELFKLTEDLPRSVRSTIEALPREFDPNVSVPTAELRAKVTAAQKAAVEALGTIAETEHARLRGLTESVLTAALKQHLDAAATTGPEAARAVQAIRNRDKWFATLLAMDKGLETRAAKEMLKKKTLSELASGMVSKHGPMAAVPLALMGHPAAAVGAAALPLVQKGAGMAARGGNDALARLLYAASQGDARATRMLDMAKRFPAAAARIAGQQAVAAGQP